jgi:hypothetical protein
MVVPSVRWPEDDHVAPLWDHTQAAPPSTRRPKGDYRDAHTSSAANRALSTVAKRRTVVMGDGPGGSSRCR